MKANIHPQWVKTQVSCSTCGTTFMSYSTVPEIKVEICSNCHPFYTGKQKLIDTTGRVDKFRAKTERAKQLRQTKPIHKLNQQAKERPAASKSEG